MSSAMRYRAQQLLGRSRPYRALGVPPRRFVQIAATPSSTNPTVASAAADSTAPGILLFVAHTYLALAFLTQSCRCPIRGLGQPFFSSLGLHLGFAEPLYPQGLAGWLPRQC